ncbi:receptor-like protein EIX1 isoform X2 [Neltuma alba]|uniref:receptor-like protein EIX1 isoform X2 n=1 Tax=Neltuma alba TaxID=207710 RepID=UPI0010A3B963|nr:receptor-like protein EIX1 isoform X2 [Prosopis alba]
MSAFMLPKGMFTLRGQCNEKDRHLLLNFKHTLVDPSTILSDWTRERDCCEWAGVRCDNTTGRVVELSLPCSPESSPPDGCDDEKSHCLTGDLNLSLLQLEFLNYLDLSNNDFQAIVQKGSEDVTNCDNMPFVHHPHSCENSSNLHYLDLSENENLYIDNIHWLSRVSSLKYLSLGGIDLQKEIDWLQLATLLPSLTELHLDGCSLRNINPSLPFVNFTSLEVLDLPFNAFSTQFLPHWLFNLSDLTVVDLRYNHFQGQLPKSLLNLRNIKELLLTDNKLSGLIPGWLGQLEYLQVLGFAGNMFCGPIPSTLGNLSSLIVLDVRSNYLNDSVPESLGQLLKLELLSLGDNHLTGHLTDRIFANLSNLEYLSMGSPGLIFDFHSLWVPPFQLEELILTNMTGPKLPPWIYTQTSLISLEIGSSRISFEPKDKFWGFATQLAKLELHDNWVKGDMSNVLLDNRWIILDSNKFESGLPRLSPNVVLFSASDSSFQGSLSPLLCQKMNGNSQLRYIDLSNNSLSGELTDCWMKWKSLVIVKLSNNNLTGTIPPSLSFLSNLTILQLDKNVLFGKIPFSLKNCQNLQILDLEENKLSGSIPNWIGHNVKVLLLRSNQLSGTIPLRICQLFSLTILDLADNKISGSIPTCLHNMTAMAFPPSSITRMPSFCFTALSDTLVFVDSVMLHAKGQGLIYKKHLQLFEGNIPREIGGLKQLESLDLASNRLSGEIPPSLAQLTFLGTLNLSFNNFSGKIPSGTQLQGFDPQCYAGNSELCGAPLQKNCTDQQDMEPIEGNNSQGDEFLPSFYIGLGVGFATAFWGVNVAIFFNRNVRHSYFRFLYYIRDELYVTMVLRMNCFRR